MPRKTKKSEAAQPDFEKECLALLETKEGARIAMDFLLYFSCLLDSIVEQDNTWLNLGLSKSTYQPLITLHEGKAISYAGGCDLRDFLGQFNSL